MRSSIGLHILILSQIILSQVNIRLILSNVVRGSGWGTIHLVSWLKETYVWSRFSSFEKFIFSKILH